MKKIKINTDQLDLTPFDENQQEAVLQLVQATVDQMSEATEEDLDDFSPLPPSSRRLLAKDEAKAANMLNVWKSGGKIKGLEDPVKYEELCAHDRAWKAEWTKASADAGFTSTDHPMLIERAISEVVKEAIEPNIVLTPLLQRINFSHGTQLTFPAMGAFPAADIPEGGEYPERSLDFAGQVVATIGKSGVAVKMTDEMIRYSLYDVMSMNLRAAGRSLIRWKESKVADLITSNAGGNNTIFSNSSGNFPSTTGRNAGGAYNGTLTLDDIFTAYATMVDRGFNPNTMIMHPFAWQIFADEAIARAFGFINGLAMWQQLQGSVGTAPSQSGPSALLSQSQPSDPGQLATTFTNVPSQFPAAFSIIVSPYMPFNATTKRTDIVFCDRSELGLLVVDEEVVTEEFDDPARDIRKVKLRERYGLASLNNGAGTGIIASVAVDRRGFDFTRKLAPATVTMPGNQPLSGDGLNTGEV